jgi:hypothetical protein
VVHHLFLGSEAETGSRGIEDDVLALQEDITEDGESNASVALDTTKASRAALLGGGVVDQVTGDNSVIARDGDGEVGELGRAVESVATSLLVVLSTIDLLVVGRDNIVVEEKESGAGVSNTGKLARALGGANLVGIGIELPETLGVIDIGVSEGAGVLGGVSETEVVDTGGVVLQSNTEDGVGELGLDGVKEGGLSLGLDGVDGAESKTQETVVVLVLDELLADLGSSLDSLARGSDRANLNSVLVDITASGGAITVGDGPGSTRDLGTVVGLVDIVTLLLAGRELRRENPQIGGASVEVQVQGSSTNVDRGQVLKIITIRSSGGRAASGSSSPDSSGDLSAELVQSLSVGVGVALGAGSRNANLVDRELLAVRERIGHRGQAGDGNGEFAEHDHGDYSKKDS